jgi:hypothetical protein
LAAWAKVEKAALAQAGHRHPATPDWEWTAESASELPVKLAEPALEPVVMAPRLPEVLAVSEPHPETSPEEHDAAAASLEQREAVDASGRLSWAASCQVLKAASARGQMARACWADAWMVSKASHRASRRQGHGAVEQLASPVHRTSLEAEHLPLTRGTLRCVGTQQQNRGLLVSQ